MQKGVPQIMDITSIKSLLHDLSKNILPSRFETAQQPESNTIQLCFRGVDFQTWLEVSWHGEAPRILKINQPEKIGRESTLSKHCLLYTSPSPRDGLLSRMPSSA